MGSNPTVRSIRESFNGRTLVSKTKDVCSIQASRANLCGHTANPNIPPSLTRHTGKVAMTAVLLSSFGGHTATRTGAYGSIPIDHRSFMRTHSKPQNGKYSKLVQVRRFKSFAPAQAGHVRSFWWGMSSGDDSAL